MRCGRSALQPARLRISGNSEEISFMAVELRQSFPASDPANILQGNGFSQPTLATWYKLNWVVFLPLLSWAMSLWLASASLAWFVVELVMR
jgi:hypothetical protein